MGPKTSNPSKTIHRIPPAHVSYFCKKGEVRPVKNTWATRNYKLRESCYQEITKIFGNENGTSAERDT